MGKINVLDIETVNKIAAGEVVERPASVVKELVENSIDAGSDAITVEIKNGGISFIRITDNGSGIDKSDVETAFLPHSTSKIKSIDDLYNLYTMGFRGEALASIASVAKVDVITKSKGELEGTVLSLEGGKIISKSETGCPDGTTMVVKELFYNTPARMNFLKKDVTEAAHITEIVDRMILGNPTISFKYINGGRETRFSSGSGSIKDAAASVWGNEIATSLIDVDYEYEGVHVFGAIGMPYSARQNRGMQNFYVNGRWVRSKTICYAAENAYRTMLMTGKFPILVLNVELDSSLVDVNVHPSKLEIKFSDERKIGDAVSWAVQNAIFTSTKEKEVKSPVKTEQKPVLNQAETVKSEPFKFKNNNFEQKETKTFDFFSKDIIDAFKNEEKTAEAENITFEEIQELAEPETAPIISGEAPKAKVCGQVFDTYIIVQQGDKMLLIDQHAAHERIRYEQLKNSREEISQVLMFPETFTVQPTDCRLLLDNIEVFEKLGFEIEEFGENTFAARRAPGAIAAVETQETVFEILELLKKSKDVMEIYDKAMFSVACKGAVKANKKLSADEMQQLVDTVFSDEKIRTCPHGRPIIISFDKKFIEKEFKRIV
ncbi:MAG: DNA mismatch repair endonuclease MutL [Clostridia bacterium]|nr:DNA mismatch repair endonuclease MutL [Clostridia bacterium]